VTEVTYYRWRNEFGGLKGDQVKRLKEMEAGHIRSDNGPEFVAKALREWIAAVGAKTAYIEPGSPWENGYCESDLELTFNPDRLMGADHTTILRRRGCLVRSARPSSRWIVVFDKPNPGIVGQLPPSPKIRAFEGFRR
jgi:transposase InsO family protein